MFARSAVFVDFPHGRPYYTILDIGYLKALLIVLKRCLAMQYGLTVVTTDAQFLKIPQILVSHTSPAK